LTTIEQPAAILGGIPLHDGAGAVHFVARVGDGFAEFERDDLRDGLPALAHQGNRLVHERSARFRRRVTPDQKAFLRCVQRAVQLGDAR
jgi:hypothetical protein